MARPDSDRVFSTEREALQEAERLNEEPPERGYAEWSVHGRPDGSWVVRLDRRVIAEDLTISAQEYEARLLARVAKKPRRFRSANRVHVVDARLEGGYPETKLVVIFHSLAEPERLLGISERIWPVGCERPETEAAAWDEALMEVLGSRESVDRLTAGKGPDEVTWIDRGGGEEAGFRTMAGPAWLSS